MSALPIEQIPPKRQIFYNKLNFSRVARSDSQVPFFKSAFPGFFEFAISQEIEFNDSETIFRLNKRLDMVGPQNWTDYDNGSDDR
jgi:hypothetical protein